MKKLINGTFIKVQDNKKLNNKKFVVEVESGGTRKPPKKPSKLDLFIESQTKFNQLMISKFDDIGNRFDKVDAKLDEHDKRFEKLEGNVVKIFAELGEHGKKIEKMEIKVEVLSKEINHNSKEINHNSEEINSINKKIEEINEKLERNNIK